MSIASANLRRRFGAGTKFPAKARVKRFERKYEKGELLKMRLRSVVRFAVIGGIAALVLGIGAFAYFYNHYSQIVEHRVNSGFWQSRSGMYAAPFKLQPGRRASVESVTELLRRAGYVEGQNEGEIWNGSYTVTDGSIEIKSNPNYARKLNNARLTFAGNRISKITSGKAELEEYAIEPEMLTGRTETKRGKNHVLQFQDIPEHLRNAILVAEDRRFFSHMGIDPRGIGRAFIRNISDNEIRQGGSTITQQLVKNSFLSPERSFRRKFAEAFLAIALERNMTKEEIFAVYCNEIYLGQYGSSGVHGVEQAARAYFGKKLSELNLAESAAIAAMIKNPNRFAPNKDVDQARVRRQMIIREMAAAGAAGSEEAELALASDIKLAPPVKEDRSIAPYFVDAATKELEAKFHGDYLNSNFNIRVFTTIDTHLQNLAESAVANQLSKLDKVYAKKGRSLQATLIAIDPHTGQVLAMVGGRDYRESQFNRAVDAMRQPGSAFKPFVYAAAMERGMSEVTLVSDRPTEFNVAGGKPYTPANYGDSYAMDTITLKTALAKSSNVAAVKTAMETGLHNVAAKAKEFGFEGIEAYPSMALGTMEVTPIRLAAAYASFANGGNLVEPTLIDKVVSGEDEVLFLSTPGRKKIIKPQTAYMITDMLEAVVERGTARSARGALGKDVVFAGKTGSTNDGWFVGYTPNLVTVAWIGSDDNEDLHSTGGDIALPLWAEFMRSAVQTRPEFGGESFPRPEGLTTAVVDPETGMLADSFCPKSETVVVPSSAISNVKCLRHQPAVDTMMAANVEDPPLDETVITIEPAVEGEVIERDVSVGEDANLPQEQNAEPRQRAKRKEQPIKEDLYTEYLRQVGKEKPNEE